MRSRQISRRQRAGKPACCFVRLSRAAHCGAPVLIPSRGCCSISTLKVMACRCSSKTGACRCWGMTSPTQEYTSTGRFTSFVTSDQIRVWTIPRWAITPCWCALMRLAKPSRASERFLQWEDISLAPRCMHQDPMSSYTARALSCLGHLSANGSLEFVRERGRDSVFRGTR